LLYVLVVAGVIIFQFCLIAGAPWGRLTQGGRHEGALPAPARIAAGLSVFLLACMGASISSAAGMLPGWPGWTGWAALGVQVLSTVLNWITPSRAERHLWGPITAGMLGLAVYVVFCGS
jgi:hypothetical protein